MVPTWRNVADANERIVEENQQWIHERIVDGTASQHSSGLTCGKEEDQPFRAIEDLSLVIRFEDARLLLLSGGVAPLSGYISSSTSHFTPTTYPSQLLSQSQSNSYTFPTYPSTPSLSSSTSSSLSTSPPSWPSNLTILYLDSEALESPTTIRKLFEALAACTRRLEKLSLISSRDSSGAAVGEAGANFTGNVGAPGAVLRPSPSAQIS